MLFKIMIEILEPIKDNNKLTYPVIINSNLYNFEIEYDSLDVSLNSDIDGIVCLMTSVAICNKWKITSKLPIDSKLYENLQNIVKLYKKYHHKHTYLLSHITKDELNLVLDLPIVDRQKNNSGIKTSSITLGIDSTYTVLKHPEITHLLYINALDNSCYVTNFMDNIYDFATKYNKKLIYVKSNFKKVMASLAVPGINYGVFTNDPIIFASVYPLNIDTHYFNGFGGDLPCIMGQNSILDKSMESNNVTIFLELTPRICKLKYILEKDITLINKLRYCNKYEIDNDSFINCTVCGKCARTLTYFYMLDYYDQLTYFEKPTNNYLDYYLENYYYKPDKILSAIYYDKIFTKMLEIYKNGDLTNIYNYKFYFDDNDNYVGDLIPNQTDVLL